MGLDKPSISVKDRASEYYQSILVELDFFAPFIGRGHYTLSKLVSGWFLELAYKKLVNEYDYYIKLSSSIIWELSRKISAVTGLRCSSIMPNCIL